MENKIFAFLNEVFPKGSAIRHISVLTSFTAIAQGINVAIMPLLSRIYSPEDFGIMAVFVSLTSILVELSGFRYYFAIPIPKETRFANALIILSFSIQAVFVSLLCLLLYCFGKPLLTIISMENLIRYRVLIPLAIGSMGVYLILTQWAIREGLFRVIGQTRITQSVCGAITMIVLGIFGLKPLGLLLGTIIARAGGIGTLGLAIIKGKGLPRSTKRDVIYVASRYRKFPLYETWSGLLNTLGGQIVPILLISLYSSQIAGFFAMAQRLLAIPASFIGKAVGQVFYQRASIAKHQGRIDSVSIRAYTILFQVGIFPVLMLSLFAPSLFSFALGDNWIIAGYFARLIGPWVAFAFACSPLDVLFAVLEIQGTRLLIEMIQNLLKVAAVFVGTFLGGPYVSLGLLCIIGVCTYLVKMLFLLSAAGNSIREIIILPFKKAIWGFLLALFPGFMAIVHMPLVLQLAALVFSSVFYALSVHSIISRK